MILNLKKFTINFLAAFLVTFVLHFLAYRAARGFIGISFEYLMEFYVFLLILTLAHFLTLRWVFKKWSKFAGLLFTALSLLKMLLCVLYLLPYIISKSDTAIAMALNFMVVYFVFLTFEVIFVIKSMNKGINLKTTNKNH